MAGNASKKGAIICENFVTFSAHLACYAYRIVINPEVSVKRIRRLILTLSLFSLIGSFVLLLNVTAPNPTHRRYSSDTPLSTGQGSSVALGDSAERILSGDLGVPRNDQPDQRQCFCNNPKYMSPVDCRVCIGYYQGLTGPYRRPDFLANDFIGESKNTLVIPYRDTDMLNQIGDYSLVARTNKKPLYVYTRVNTVVDPEYKSMVEQTGGAIIPYFTVIGYVDPIDAAAQKGLLGSAIMLILMGVWEYGTRRKPRYASHRGDLGSSAPPPSSPRPPQPPDSRDPVGGALDALNRAQKFNKINRNKLD